MKKERSPLLHDFDYLLPPELIAHRPTDRRDGARMMILPRSTGALGHSQFTMFPDLLVPGDLLVLNNTKVFPARLVARRSSGARIEILLIRQTGKGEWQAMIKGIGRLHPGENITIADTAVRLVRKGNQGLGILSFGSDAEADRLIEQQGEIPLPPYIERPDGRADQQDQIRYQTLFANDRGSSAAPTAGLHFTKNIFDQLRHKGVEIAEVTLHVGPGTFRPVRSERIAGHVMDPEEYFVSESAAAAINKAKAEARRVIAVGSTVTRTLESLAINGGDIDAGSGATSLFITPGFNFNVVDAILTNFHLPKSTLMILISAFAGRDRIMAAYDEAVAQKYRFFSYGDCMFIS